MNFVTKNIIVSIIALVSVLSGYSQTMDDIKKEADDLFKKEAFIQATPLYLQLLNVEPRNHELNYKYGTCLLYSSQDKSEAIKFLNFSVKNPGIDNMAYFYLGKAYHLNFQFNKAITNYEKFKSIGSSSDLKKHNIEANLNACRNGRQLLTNVTDMIVLEKTEVKKEDFYELYKLNDIGGSLLITDMFQTKYDKKMGHRPIIYFPQESPYIFYSSYGENGNSGLDIYVRQKLPNGKWSEAIKVVGDVNTNEDEDYPYLSPDGKYLYYSSKGHNSMGGFDVFRSKVIIEGSSFASPENMDFAISSPDDDILYLVDSLDRTAYFSSARESQKGKLYVYKVRVEKIPMKISVIKASFKNEIDPGNREIEIVVTNSITKEEIGTFNSRPGSGDILLTIPKSGKYDFEMNVKGHDQYHGAEISIPYLKQFRPLKMQITHQYDDNDEELIIVDQLFDEQFDDPSEVMAEVYQDMAKLSPNSANFNLDSLNKLRGSDDVFIEAGIDVYATPADVEAVIAGSIEDLKKINEDNEVNSLVAHNLATKQHNKATEKMARAKILIEEAEGETDVAVKNEKLTEAYKLTQQAIALNKQASQLVSVGERIEDDIKANEKKILASDNALLDIKSVEQDDRERLISFVGEHSDLLSDAQSKENKNVLDNIESEGNAQKMEFNKISTKISDLEQRERELNNTVTRLSEKLDATKKKKDRAAIETQIEDAKSELDAVQSEIRRFEGSLDEFKAGDISSIDLAEASAAIRDRDNRTDELTAEISNTQKLKVKYLVEDQEFKSDVTNANTVFKNNNISGEYASLDGLNESMVKARSFTTEREFDNEITLLESQYEASTNESERAKILEAINQLKDLKAEKLGQGATDLATENTNIKNNLIENYDDRINEVKQIRDVAERRAQEAKLNETLDEAVKKEIKNKEKALNQDPENEDLITELNELKAVEKEINDELIAYADWKEGQKDNKQNSDVNYTYEDALTSANPDYKTRVNEIYNSDLTDEEKAEDLKSLNATTLSNAKERLQEVEATLNQSADDETALVEKKHLTRLVDELETNKALPLIEPEVKSNLEDVQEEVDPNQLVQNYDSKLEKIDKSAINNLDKEKAKMQVNNELIQKINTELSKLNTAIEAKDENAKVYKKRIENLEKLKTSVSEEVASSKAIIDEISEENPDLANSVESLFPNYTNQSYEINELATDQEKREAIRALNEEAIKAISDKRKELKIAYAANPRDELLFSMTELEELSQALATNIEEDYYGVVVFDEDENFSKIKSGVSIYDIMPDIDERMEIIEEEAISKKDLEKKKIALNEEVVSKIDQNIRKLENAINTHPENTKQLSKRIENLEEIRSLKVKEIEDSKTLIGEEFLKYNIVVKVEDANPDYLTELQSISALDNESDQSEAVKELNKSTVKLIDEKIATLESEMTGAGSDKKNELLIQKYKELKATIEANPELPAAGSISDIAQNNNPDDPGIEIDNTTERDSSENTGTVEFPVIYEEATIDEIVPGYNDRITNIQESLKPVAEIEKDKIALYDEALEKIDSEIKELETYSRIDSPNKDYAEKKSANLFEMKKVIEGEKEKSQTIIESSETPSDLALDITDIMPDYETRKEKIEYDSTSDIDKKQRTNELNNVLLFEIEKERESLKEILKDDPSNAIEIEESIEKLNELSSAIQKEVDTNNEYLDAANADETLAIERDATGKINPIDPDHFEGRLDPEKVSLIKKDLGIIENFENDIEKLERKQARLSEKDARKLDKEIEKLKVNKSKLHNRLIIDLETVISEDLKESLDEAKENAILVKSTGEVNDDIRNANEGLEMAQEKISAAKALRAEAADTKSDILSNELLKKAAMFEYEAKELLEKSNRIYKSAIVISSVIDSDEVVMKVPENENEKKSAQLYDLADEMELEANKLQLRSQELKDSMETVKKKYRQAIVNQIEAIEDKEAELRDKEYDLREKAAAIEEEENLLADIIPNQVSKEVSNVDQLAVLKTSEYKTYYEEKTAADESFKDANNVNARIEELKAKAARKIKKAIVTGQAVDEASLQDDEEINKILDEINILRARQESYRNEAIQHYQEADQILKTMPHSDNMKENMMAMATNKIAPETNITLTAEDIDNTVVQNNPPADPLVPQDNNTTFPVVEEASSDFVPPTRLNGQIFRKTTSAVYSRDNPIPVDAKQPEGLVYKVQVGAFRNALPPEHFDKFAPISGQVLDNGVTRYMVGYFTNFVPANDAKTEIHGIGGYDDAFVVAYLNGVRISIAEARSIEEGGIIPTLANNNEPVVTNDNPDTDVNNANPVVDNSNPNNPVVDNTPVNNNPVVDNTPTNNTPDNTSNNTSNASNSSNNNNDNDVSFVAKTEKEREAASYYLDVPDAAPANQVEIIHGLFYTVQIGVYSKPVPASELFDVSPLNSQLTESGKIRYSTGIYASVEAAVVRKQELIEIGLVDAFVTAYYNGKRITIAESRALLETEGPEILSDGKTISDVTESPAARYNKDNIYYRILIGKYENFVPSNVANYLFNDDNIVFETEIDADNNVYLYTQKFADLNDVKKRLVEINELGFENMKIISYYNIQIIPFGEAMNVLNGTQENDLSEYDYPEGISVDDIFYEADAIYYRIEFGTFSSEIPNEIMVATNQITEYDIEQETDADGNIILRTSNIETFEEAQGLLDRVSSDIPEAEIVAFHKYVKISVSKAREIKGR